MVQATAAGGGTIKPVQQLEAVTVRFAGDSGDGMQLLGTQFASISAALGNDVSTLPDYPAEIRAPAGTLGGVSGFQITFSSGDILTPGDTIDTLVAMNPAALRAGIGDVEPGGVVITNQDEFTKHHLDKAALVLILGGKANNTQIDVTFAALGDALQEWVDEHGPRSIPVVIGRGGPGLVQGFGSLKKTLDNLGMPYVFFGPDTPITMVAAYATQLADHVVESNGGSES